VQNFVIERRRKTISRCCVGHCLAELSVTKEYISKPSHPAHGGMDSGADKEVTCAATCTSGLAGIPWHVTQKGNNLQACFYASADYRRYLQDLASRQGGMGAVSTPDV